MFEGCRDKTREEGMGSGRFGLIFGVELRCDIPRMIGQLEDFHERIVGRSAAEDDSCGLESAAKRVVDLVAVAVTLANFTSSVDFTRATSVKEFARVRAESHRSAFIGDVFLGRHEVDDGVRAVGHKFR